MTRRKQPTRAADLPPSAQHAIPYPHVVVIDTREQHPYEFEGLSAGHRYKHRPWVVTTTRATLQSGDYSLQGLESAVSVERKSLQDLYSTIGHSRDRFERELQRLHEGAYHVAAVVVEASWEGILRQPPIWTRLRPQTVFRSVLAWTMRYQKVHWWMTGDRRLAEVTTFRILERAAATVKTTTEQDKANV